MDIEIKQRFPRRLRTICIISVVAIILVAAVIWAVAATRTTSYRADYRGVKTANVVYGEFNDFVRLSGRVETGIVVQISALETGVVQQKWVEEGAFVNEGDIILTLRNPLLRQQILDSESQLAEKQNMLRDTELSMEKDRLQVKRDLLSARTEANRKRRAAEQQSALYDEKLTSREEFLQAREDYELAIENLKLLEERLRQDSAYRAVQLGMMRESLHNMQENFALVRQRAENLNVRASHSGQLGSLTAELGQNISAGQQVGQINILDNFKLTVNIDEHYIDRVSQGQTGKVNHRGKAFDVTVRKVYPEVTNGQFRADLDITGPLPEKLRVGQTYPIDLQLGQPERALMVERGTFYQTSGGKYVYVVAPDGKTAERREISIGRMNPRYYEITDGLAEGERIITSSYKDFGDADRIIITD